MSFSSGVKEELAAVTSQARHCRIALIAALFHLCPYLTARMAGIRTENAFALQAFENELRRVGLAGVERMCSGRETLVVACGKDTVKTFLEMVKLDRAILPEQLGE